MFTRGVVQGIGCQTKVHTQVHTPGGQGTHTWYTPVTHTQANTPDPLGHENGCVFALKTHCFASNYTMTGSSYCWWIEICMDKLMIIVWDFGTYRKLVICVT